MDIKRKLSSRKFWSYIITELMCILAFTNIADDVKSKIIALVIASANTIGYMFAESWTDVNNDAYEDADLIEDDADDFVEVGE